MGDLIVNNRGDIQYAVVLKTRAYSSRSIVLPDLYSWPNHTLLFLHNTSSFGK